MTTNQKAEKNKNFSNENKELQEFLTSLQNFKHLENYEHLGYTLHSICNVMQTALLTEMEYPAYSNHNKWDMYNLLTLIKNLIPETELELLDKLKP